jgi:hypothetical protein
MAHITTFNDRESSALQSDLSCEILGFIHLSSEKSRGLNDEPISPCSLAALEGNKAPFEGEV